MKMTGKILALSALFCLTMMIFAQAGAAEDSPQQIQQTGAPGNPHSPNTGNKEEEEKEQVRGYVTSIDVGADGKATRFTVTPPEGNGGSPEDIFIAHPSVELTNLLYQIMNNHNRVTVTYTKINHDLISIIVAPPT